MLIHQKSTHLKEMYRKEKGELTIVTGVVFTLAMLAFVSSASATTHYVNLGDLIQDTVNAASPASPTFEIMYLSRFLKLFFFDKIVVCEIISVPNEK
jgi:hypothetical protein